MLSENKFSLLQARIENGIAFVLCLCSDALCANADVDDADCVQPHFPVTITAQSGLPGLTRSRRSHA